MTAGPRAKVVGVLGGMGPDSTVDFFARLVDASRGGSDQDHLRVVIDNDPTVPDRTAGITGRGPSPAPHLAAMARGLVAQGAELLVMPCNSAHAFEEAIREAAAAVPFISLIETTVQATSARLPAARTVGLLATDGTLAAGLYHRAYAVAGVTALSPTEDDQRLVMEAIYAVKAGRQEQAGELLRGVAMRLASAGAEAVAMACTEVPLVLREGDVVGAGGQPLPLIDSTGALVERTVAAARDGTLLASYQAR